MWFWLWIWWQLISIPIEFLPLCWIPSLGTPGDVEHALLHRLWFLCICQDACRCTLDPLCTDQGCGSHRPGNPRFCQSLHLDRAAGGAHRSVKRPRWGCPKLGVPQMVGWFLWTGKSHGYMDDWGVSMGIPISGNHQIMGGRVGMCFEKRSVNIFAASPYRSIWIVESNGI